MEMASHLVDKDNPQKTVPQRGTADGAARVHVVNGGGGGEGGGASAVDIGAAVDDALRDSPLPVSGTVALSNPPDDPPSAAAIGNDLRGGAALPSNILFSLGGAKRVSAGSTSARVQLATSNIR